MIRIKDKLTKIMIGSFTLVSFFSVENMYALEENQIAKDFFPVGVYFVRGQKPIEDDILTWDNGDFRGDPVVAQEQYDIEFKDLKDYGFNTAILNIEPLVHPNVYSSKVGEERRLAIKSIVDKVLTAATNNNIQIVPTMQKLNENLNNYSVLDENSIKNILIDDHIEYFNQSKNILGYQVIDEPNIYVNKEYLRKAKNVIKEFDNNGLAISTWNDINTIGSLYNEITPDIVLIDVYPFSVAEHSGFPYQTRVGDLEDAFPRGKIGSQNFNKGLDQPTFSEWISSAKEQIGDTPLWVAIQSFGGDTYFRDVSAEEVRLQSFMAIKNGAKGLFYFLYQSEANEENPSLNLNGLMDNNYQPTLLALEAKEINKEVNHISPILLKIRNTKVNYISVESNREYTQHEAQTFVHENGDKYFMAVNANTFQSEDLVVKLKKSWFTNLEGISFIDVYEPNDIFVVDTASDEENIIITLTDTKAADGRLIKINEFKSTSLYESNIIEKKSANNNLNDKTFFGQLGKLNELLSTDEKFKSFNYSVKINDNNAMQRYQIGIRLGNETPSWIETDFFSNGDYEEIGDGWKELSFNFADVINTELSNGNNYLTRIYVRAYNSNSSNYTEYEVKDYSITYEKEKLVLK